MKRICSYSTLGIVQLAKTIAAALFIMAFILSTLLSPVYSQVNIISSSSSQAIPDNDPAGVSDTLVVSDSGSLADLNVEVNVTHTWVGDVIIELTHVDTETSVTIIDRPGKTSNKSSGCDGHDIVATLDDEADPPPPLPLEVEDVCEPGTPTINGTFIPNNLLSAFDSENLSGEWTLTVSDNAEEDTGTLVSWGLVLTETVPMVWVEFIYSGPESGTESQPYNTLAEAVNAVAVGGEIKIKGGSTDETLTIDKEVTINNVGETTATIGQPE